LRILFVIIAVLPPICSQSVAHDTIIKNTAAVAIGKPALEIAIISDPAKPVPLVRIPHGAVVHLSIQGAGDHELHLHGYDISVKENALGFAVFVFEARHTGRFAIVTHDVEDLLGRSEKAIAYVEVRDP